MRPRRFRSFAKINLGLEVVGKLPGGYHELKTLFASISLHDIVEVAETKTGVRVHSDHPDVPRDETNLAHKAAMLMQRMAGRKSGVEIRIKKRIPVGGGLGGGSSNAATVLRALDLLWGVGLGPFGLLDAAKTLGADVPYFLFGGPALGVGRGDDIQPLNARLREKVLIVPGKDSVSTAHVFRRFAAETRPAEATSPIEAYLRALRDKGGDQRGRALCRLRNDLEAAALAQSPSLASMARDVRRIARDTGAGHVAMSGSGSSFFLLFGEDESNARLSALKALREIGLLGVRCSFLSKRTYQSRFEIMAPGQATSRLRTRRLPTPAPKRPKAPERLLR